MSKHPGLLIGRRAFLPFPSLDSIAALDIHYLRTLQSDTVVTQVLISTKTKLTFLSLSLAMIRAFRLFSARTPLQFP